MGRPRSHIPPRDLFMQRVKVTDDCWIWRGPLDRDGYGEWQYAEERTRAHRWAYKLFVGPLMAGAVICHNCDNPSCVNPAHLFAGAQQDNMNDMRAKGRKAPKHGEFHHMCKLNDHTVATLRAANDGKRGTGARLARAWGLNQQTVADILAYRRWKHLP